MNDLLTGSFATHRWEFWPRSFVRVVSWNIDRGTRLKEIIQFLGDQKADILVLQEVDVNARRTRRVNVAEEIARRLQMDYVFGREFEELTQGSPSAPAYHGQATLSRWPIENSRIVRFQRQSSFWRPRWYLPRTQPFQERIGGRIALVSRVRLRTGRLLVYNLHLESRGGEALRASQLAEALHDSASDADQHPVLLAGDLNFDVSRNCAGKELRRFGFHSAVTLPAAHTTTPRGLFRTRKTIDWAYIAGPVEVSRGMVHDDVNASDHYPMSFDLTLR